jgi:carnitine O-acetyltransferase
MRAAACPVCVCAGMKLLKGKDEPMPALYKDPAYSKLNHWAISTSNLSSEHFANWGWGEVVEDGIGVRAGRDIGV